MNKIAIGGAVVLVVVLILGVKELFYMGDDTVKMHTAESLLMVRSQVEKALPADYPAEKVMAAFDGLFLRVGYHYSSFCIIACAASK